MLRKYIVAASVCVIAGCWAFFEMGAVFCQATLHVPRNLSETPPDATAVSIAAADKANLSACFFRPSMPNGNCVAVLHGIGDSRAGSVGFASMFLKEGYFSAGPR